MNEWVAIINANISKVCGQSMITADLPQWECICPFVYQQAKDKKFEIQ